MSAHLHCVFVELDGSDGEGETEGGASAEAAFRGDLPTEGFDEAADKGEAESGAAVRHGAEAVEDGAEAVCGDALAGVADGELDESLALFGGEDDFTAGGSVAEGVGEEVVEDGANGAAVGSEVGEVGEGLDFDADGLADGEVDVAVAGLDEHGVGAEVFEEWFAVSAVEFGDVDEVGHEVFQLFCFLAGGDDQLGLEWTEFAREALAEGVESAAELEERVAEFFGSNGDELALEAVGIGETGDIFEGGDRTEEPAFGVAHGGGAKAEAASEVANTHGEQGGIAFGGNGLLHFDGVSDSIEDFFAAGGVGEGHAVLGGVAEDLGGGLVELEDLTFAVGDDDGLKDGLEDGVGELEFHLSAAHFGFAEFTEANGEAVHLLGNLPEAVAGVPLGAMGEVALGDAADVFGELGDGAEDEVEGEAGGEGGRA